MDVSLLFLKETWNNVVLAAPSPQSPPWNILFSLDLYIDDNNRNNRYLGNFSFHGF